MKLVFSVAMQIPKPVAEFTWRVEGNSAAGDHFSFLLDPPTKTSTPGGMEYYINVDFTVAANGGGDLSLVVSYTDGVTHVTSNAPLVIPECHSESTLPIGRGRPS
jgi:hypothetical protein